MVQKVDRNIFEGINPNILMEATYQAAENFQIRAFYEAKEEILAKGKISEVEFYNILDGMLDAETERKLILDRIKNWDPLFLDEIVEKINDFPPENIISDIIYLKEQGYIEELVEIKTKKVKKKIKGEEKEVEEKEYFYRYQAKDLSPNFKENHFEPVSIVYEAGACCHCGWCSSICPVNAIKVTADLLEIDDDLCMKCSLCFSVCPRSFSIDRVYEGIKKLDESYNWSDKIGAYLNTYTGTTTKDKIEEVCQDGGIVTSILFYLLEKNLVDAVVAVQHSNEYWKPEPIIVDNVDDLYKTGGTKYANSPSLTIIDKCKEYNKIAFVGVPCMLKAIEKGKFYPMGLPFFDNIEYTIGLFCMESFPYDGIIQLANEQFNKDIHDITKMNIGGGKFIIKLKSGDEMNVPLKDVQSYARENCHYCEDLTSDYADISVGSIGSKGGWSSIVTRSKKGEELLKAVVKGNLIEIKSLKETKPGQFLVEKIAGIKRKKCRPIKLYEK